ncbi:hypothetical protein NDU88_003242 [Pleurodeles waltl]|uniref:Uncharacterized protein n=1 Tax=Pleurodeles waltl TaxID=8319 RepID=A0AAV7VG17_PLEWA|nr:hypothetical protein NDU88_003242 [Pleurodeles waltl]
MIRLRSSDEDPAVRRLLVEGRSLGAPVAAAGAVSGVRCAAPFTVRDLGRLRPLTPSPSVPWFHSPLPLLEPLPEPELELV